MAHAEEHIVRSPEEEIFDDYLKNGDDFRKIEIYKLAKYWYQKALETGIETELVKSRLDELNKKIRFERKVITILASIAAIIVIGVIFINCN
jgi:hypothetical protein